MLPPPRGASGAIGWMRANLFSSLAEHRRSRSSASRLVVLDRAADRPTGPSSTRSGRARTARPASLAGAPAPAGPSSRRSSASSSTAAIRSTQRWRVDVTVILLLRRRWCRWRSRGCPTSARTRSTCLSSSRWSPLILLTGGNFDSSSTSLSCRLRRRGRRASRCGLTALFAATGTGPARGRCVALASPSAVVASASLVARLPRWRRRVRSGTVAFGAVDPRSSRALRAGADRARRWRLRRSPVGRGDRAARSDAAAGRHRASPRHPARSSILRTDFGLRRSRRRSGAGSW